LTTRKVTGIGIWHCTPDSLTQWSGKRLCLYQFFNNLRGFDAGEFLV
jgi:hypothetical protein